MQVCLRGSDEEKARVRRCMCMCVSVCEREKDIGGEGKFAKKYPIKCGEESGNTENDNK